MQIAILIFDKLAAQDAVGPYEVMRNVPEWDVEFVAKRKGEVRAEGGLGLISDRAIDEVDSADVVLVPGGFGNRPMLTDEEVLSWLRQVDATTKWTTSVCTGSLVLGLPACSRASGRPETGWCSTPSAITGPIRSAAASSRTER